MAMTISGRGVRLAGDPPSNACGTVERSEGWIATKASTPFDIKAGCSFHFEGVGNMFVRRDLVTSAPRLGNTCMQGYMRPNNMVSEVRVSDLQGWNIGPLLSGTTLSSTFYIARNLTPRSQQSYAS
jgi:hypothetical protein